MSPLLHAYFSDVNRSLASIVVDQHVRPVLLAFSPELHSFVIPSYNRIALCECIFDLRVIACILNTRRKYLRWVTYLCCIFFLKFPAGKRFGINQAKNVVFFQIQVAFSALRHWVSDNRRVVFGHRPCKELLFFFFCCSTGRLCKHPCFLFFRHCRERWGFRSRVMLIWISEVML